MQQQQQQQEEEEERVRIASDSMYTSDSMYMRPLPNTCIAFSSVEGRKLFREALADGTLEGYFSLASQFVTQQEPAYCGLGSLVMALNALGTDPRRVWKGPWRWLSEEMLDCCSPLEVIKAHGVTMAQFACLARCNGAAVTTKHPGDNHTVNELREDVRRVLSSIDAATVIVASYDRQGLGQTGTGHFSPIGGYHAGRDLVLIMDVARFKYPPHWVSLTQLYSAMIPKDPSTDKSRGWHLLSRASDQMGRLRFRAHISSPEWQGFISRVVSLKDESAVLATLVEASREPGFPQLDALEQDLQEAFESLAVYRRIPQSIGDMGTRIIISILYEVIVHGADGSPEWSPGVRAEIEAAWRVINTMKVFCCLPAAGSTTTATTTTTCSGSCKKANQSTTTTSCSRRCKKANQAEGKEKK